ncbi:cryptochrome/photolyase family protein [Dokdonia ponticola]|uniref:Cryptochrome/photolyase family protein n=1 Tax=Dokdonia ponticola TaxID=2041041 RepID=A0ABV9HU90_9FLAO
MKKGRLILGDQLNHNHSWYTKVDDQVVYFMAEMKQEATYVTHHIQKVVAFFCAMRSFADHLKNQGHSVVYYTLDDTQNQETLTENIKHFLKENACDAFEYQLPDEYRLDEELVRFRESGYIPTTSVDSEHFMTSRNDLSAFFEGKKQYTMEYFYRMMRKKYDLMMINDKDPEGGKWNFDQSNRKKWKQDTLIPTEKTFEKDVSDLVKLLEDQEIKTMGNINPKTFGWPTTREESLGILDYFCEHLLVHFGDYQDAMDPDQAYLYHSRLSFAMNSKLLSPEEVVTTVISYWRSHQDTIDISQVEGFVRQIIGWREYMRGMYWMQMPEFASVNYLENHNPLPDFYWTGKTKMNCLKCSIQNSLDNAYAHHIQRLMITGNYALLTMTEPSEVDLWYLGIYIDAIEWVEITNTRGMSQWADGGKIATKPYVSSGSYINKMSNYCKGCHYKVSKKTGEDACPFNSLYWNFLDEKQSFFKDNQRMRMMLSLLNKMDKNTLIKHKERAQDIIENPSNY